MAAVEFAPTFTWLEASKAPNHEGAAGDGSGMRDGSSTQFTSTMFFFNVYSGINLTADFGAVKSVNRVDLRAYSTPDYLNGAPVDYSVDGVSWTPLFTVAGAVIDGYSVHSFSPVEARYVRLGRASGPTGTGVSEFRIFGEEGGGVGGVTGDVSGTIDFTGSSEGIVSGGIGSSGGTGEITFVGAGDPQATKDAITLVPPAGIQAKDFLIIPAASRGTAVTIPGWAELDVSPQNDNADGTANRTRLTGVWKWADGSDGAVTNDAGDYTVGQIFAFRGVDENDPFDAMAGNSSGASSTTATFPAVNTTIPKAMIVYLLAHGIDSNAAQVSDWTNAALTDLIEIGDASTSEFSGGGMAAACGTLAAPGSTGSTTATLGTSAYSNRITLALKPAAAASTGITGEASGILPLTGTATATTPRNAAASGTIAFTGSATARVQASASASGDIAFTGASTGQVVTTALASGAIDLTGSATARLQASASAAGDIAFAGAANGTVSIIGAGDGVLSLTGAAVGELLVRGSASGTLALSGSATGSGVLVILGDASGTIDFTGAASGAVLVAGTSDGVLPLGGSAFGTVSVVGTSDGVLPLGGSASGAVLVTGEANGSLDLTGSATAAGTLTTSGAAVGSIALGGSATATIGVQGSVSGALGLDGSVSGQTVVRVSAAGSFDLTGSATGAITTPSIDAAAAGSLPLGGSAQAVVAITAVGAGLVEFTGSAAAVVYVVGTVAGGIDFTGSGTISVADYDFALDTGNPWSPAANPIWKPVDPISNSSWVPSVQASWKPAPSSNESWQSQIDRVKWVA